MITALHTLVYAYDAETARAFFRDVPRWPSVDTGGGWLIFKTGPSELGVHPTTEGEWSTEQKMRPWRSCENVAPGSQATLPSSISGGRPNPRSRGGPEVML